MKRCCYFFGSFVAAILLSVATGTFDQRPEVETRPQHALEATVASQDKKERSGQASAEIKGSDPFEKPVP